MFPGLKLIVIGDELSKHPDLRRTVVRSRMQNDVRFSGIRAHRSAADFSTMPPRYLSSRRSMRDSGFRRWKPWRMARPWVTSNTSSLPEVVGNAAVLVNPENVFENYAGAAPRLTGPVTARQTERTAATSRPKAVLVGRLGPAGPPHLPRGGRQATRQKSRWQTSGLLRALPTLSRVMQPLRHS